VRLWIFEDWGEEGDDDEEGVACVDDALDLDLDCGG
jgi:hypothetical protein